jgi:antitoxin MazE
MDRKGKMSYATGAMKMALTRIGNSQGIILPKPFLAQLGLRDEVDVTLNSDSIVLRKPQQRLREGWAEASKALAVSGEDELVWPEFANADDADLRW